MRKLFPLLFVIVASCSSPDTAPNNKETSISMDNLHYDFDLRDDRINLPPKLLQKDLKRFEKKTQFKLPVSFKNWLLNFSDGAVFDIGNLLAIEPLIGKESISDYCTKPKQYYLPEKLLPFARDGGGELWCFYKIENAKSNEYPIVWVSIGSASNKGYVYCNSSFDRFLNINVLHLLAIANDEEEIEDHEQIFMDLYKKYDPKINLISSDYHDQAIEFSELEKQISTLQK